MEIVPKQMKHTEFYVDSVKGGFHSIFPENVSFTFSVTLVGGLVYFCCSHLEHRASMKHFVSLQFRNLRHSVELLGRVISPLQGCYLTQTQNKHKQTSIPWVGFKPMIPAFVRVKTFHALNRAATVIGLCDTVSEYITQTLITSH
jgi:hypothetical protein